MISADSLFFSEIDSGETAVIDEAAAIECLCLGQGEKMHGLHNGTGILGTLYFTAGQQVIDEFGTIVAALMAIGDPKGSQIQSPVVVAIVAAIGGNGIDSGLDLPVLLRGNGYVQNQNPGLGEPFESTPMRRFFHKATPEGIVRMLPSEGVHHIQIRYQTDGGVVIFCFGEQFDDSGKQGSGLTDDDINMLFQWHCLLLNFCAHTKKF